MRRMCGRSKSRTVIDVVAARAQAPSVPVSSSRLAMFCEVRQATGKPIVKVELPLLTRIIAATLVTAWFSEAIQKSRQISSEFVFLPRS